LYLADQETDQVFELYSAPIGGGTPVKLNGALASGGKVKDSFKPSPDGSRVVYIADQQTDDQEELYSVPAAGGAPVKLNGLLPPSEDVGVFLISPNSAWVLYSAGEEEATPTLFSVPINGGTPVMLLDREVNSLAISPDSSQVVYSTDLDVSGMYELYSLPIGGGTSVKLNDLIVSGGDVISFQVASNSSFVVYMADQQVDEKFELFSTLYIPYDIRIYVPIVIR
jgi:Tol biopolymer transport system component